MWMMPLLAARARKLLAAKTRGLAASVLPSASALRAFLTEVRKALRKLLFCSVRLIVCRLRFAAEG